MMGSLYQHIHAGFKVEVDGLRRPRRLPWELGVRITDLRDYPESSMLRFHASVAPAPGSHKGYWRTRVGTLTGHNLRLGSPHSPRCLTMLVHKRRGMVFA